MQIKKIILITGAPGTCKTLLRTDLMDALGLTNSVYVKQRDLAEWFLFAKPDTEAVHSELTYTDIHKNLLSVAVLTPFLGKPTKVNLLAKPFTLRPVFIITGTQSFHVSKIQKKYVANIHLCADKPFESWRSQLKGMGIEELIAFINKL